MLSLKQHFQFFSAEKLNRVRFVELITNDNSKRYKYWLHIL